MMAQKSVKCHLEDPKETFVLDKEAASEIN
jgi:hypothetical protein